MSLQCLQPPVWRGEWLTILTRHRPKRFTGSGLPFNSFSNRMNTMILLFLYCTTILTDGCFLLAPPSSPQERAWWPPERISQPSCSWEHYWPAPSGCASKPASACIQATSATVPIKAWTSGRHDALGTKLKRYQRTW